ARTARVASGARAAPTPTRPRAGSQPRSRTPREEDESPRGCGLRMTRQGVVDLEPRRLRVGEDVLLHARAGRVVERAGGHDREPAGRVEARHRRAALAAEGLREEAGLGDLVAPDGLLAADPMEAAELERRVGGEGRAACPAAARAVAVAKELERP